MLRQIKSTLFYIGLLHILSIFCLYLFHYSFEQALASPYFSSTNKSMSEFDNNNSKVLIIYDVNLIDVIDSIKKNSVTIIIDNNSIYDIIDSNNNHSSVDEFIKKNPQVTIVNATGKYLIPGLIDMHAHVAGVLKNSFNYSLAVETLDSLLNNGVTTIRNPGGPTQESVDLKKRITSGEIDGPQILTAGQLLNSPSQSIPFVEKSVRTENEVRAEVKKQANLGVDFIKLYVGLTPDLVRTAIDEANLHNIKVIGHLYATSWTDAASMGIDYLTHGVPVNLDTLSSESKSSFTAISGGPFDHFFWLKLVNLHGKEIDNMIQSLSRNNVSVDPTLSIYEVMLQGHPDAEFFWSKIAALTKKMYDNGVNLLAGTDIPNFGLIPGESLHHELELLSETGIPNSEILRIATINAGRSLGLDDEIGTIEKNKQADLVILSSNPLVDIRNTKDIYLIINNGKIVSS